MNQLFRACKRQVEQEQRREWFDQGCAEVHNAAHELFSNLLDQQLECLEKVRAPETKQDYLDVFHDAFLKTEQDVIEALNEGYVRGEQAYAEEECEEGGLYCMITSTHPDMKAHFLRTLNLDNLIWESREAQYLNRKLKKVKKPHVNPQVKHRYPTRSRG